MGKGEWLKGVGLFLALAGLGCLPLGIGSAHPRFHDNIFHLAANSGAVFWVGVALIPTGLALMIGSRWLD